MTQNPSKIVVGVILAAGASSRMGRPKALIPMQDGSLTFLEHLAAVLSEGGCTQLICVAGCHVSEIASELPENVLLARNPHWQRGQLSSVKTGLAAALAFRPSRIVMHLVDYPLIVSRDVQAVLSAEAADVPLAVAGWNGVSGHPVSLSPELARRVLQDTESVSFRDSLARLAPERDRRIFGASKGTILTANTPEELAALGLARGNSALK